MQSFRLFRNHNWTLNPTGRPGGALYPLQVNNLSHLPSSWKGGWLQDWSRESRSGSCLPSLDPNPPRAVSSKDSRRKRKNVNLGSGWLLMKTTLGSWMAPKNHGTLKESVILFVPCTSKGKKHARVLSALSLGVVVLPLELSFEEVATECTFRQGHQCPGNKRGSSTIHSIITIVNSRRSHPLTEFILSSRRTRLQ